MKKLISKAVNYAKRNPEQTKQYAKKAYDSVQKYKKNSKNKPNSKY